MAESSNDFETATLAAGCFWCVEAVFDDLNGVEDVVSGYSGGHTETPTYRQVCDGNTGHAEVAEIKFDSNVISFKDILRVFFSVHDPTTMNRQGNDVGTQYRSAIYYNTAAEGDAARASRDRFQEALAGAGLGTITTEIREAPAFYYAEPYHQQYLARNPNGYCGLGGTGVSCPISALA